MASLVGIASFDFFFVHPFYTFSVADVRYVLTFGVMLVVALVIGNLTGRIRSQAEAAREREQRTSALYGLSRELAAARDRDAVVAAALRSLRDTFALDAAVLLPDDGGRGGRRSAGAVSARRAGAGRGAVELRSRPGGRARHDDAARRRGALPAARVVGHARSASSGCRSPMPADFRDPARRRLLETLAGQTAVALERLALAERSREPRSRSRRSGSAPRC